MRIVYLFFLLEERIAYHSGRAIKEVGFDGLDTGIVGSIPTQCVGVYDRLSVLCFPLYVEALRWANPRARSRTKCRKEGSETSEEAA
jgi:hypothetical protein